MHRSNGSCIPFAAALALAPLSAQAGGDQACDRWGALQSLGAVLADDVDELSGMAASQRHGDLLWVHDDSGGGALLHAVTASTGAYQAAVAIPEADNEDWEDLAIGPCPDEACGCLYIADAGSADRSRQTGILWVLPEPDPADGVSVAATAIRFAWPDGGHDAETLLVDPLSGEAVLVTKEPEGPAQVYAFPTAPPQPGGTVTLEWVGEIDLSAVGAQETSITGGAVSPGGERIALRTDKDLLVFTVGEAGLVAALGYVPDHLDAPPSENGEALTFSADGSALYLLNEGDSPLLWTLACAEPVDAHAVDAGLDECAAVTEKEGCGCASGGSSASLGLAIGALLLGLRRRGAAGRP